MFVYFFCGLETFEFNATLISFVIVLYCINDLPKNLRH